MNKTKINKKVMLFSILLLFLLCISCVSANDSIDDNSTDEVLNSPMEDVGTDDEVLTTDTSDSIGSSATNDTLSSADDTNVLKYTDDVGTFTDLRNEISSVDEGQTLLLTQDYVYNSSVDIAKGGEYSKEITIDGQGHILDGLKRNKSKAKLIVLLVYQLKIYTVDS